MHRRHAHELGKAARIKIGILELRAHGNISMTTVVTLPTGNVMSYDDAIARLKFVTPRFDDMASYFMTQHDRFFQRLKTDLVHVRKADSAGRNLQKNLPIPKRWSRNFLNSRLMFLRNNGLHQLSISSAQRFTPVQSLKRGAIA
jgi:hypothetical protein